MPDKHFTEYVEIENFKCFDSLKAENLKRVNLLGGDNNVGKEAYQDKTYKKKSFISTDMTLSEKKD